MTARLLDENQRRTLGILAAAAAAVLAAGLLLEPRRAWSALLMANFFFVCVALGGLVFAAIQRLSSAGWSALFCRVPEAMGAYLPVGAALMALQCFGVGKLYPWADSATVAADPVLRAKTAFLNPVSFFIISAVCFAVWYGLSRSLIRLSRAQDERDGADLSERAMRVSAAFLVAFSLTFTAAAILWIMSLEPDWYSTIYPWYLFSGLFMAGLAVMVLLLLLLHRRGLYRELNSHHFHDLGKYLFAFSCFWAYLWFCQYLLIWYSNLPEETAHYVTRMANGWKPLFWLNPIVNFALPFALLLPAGQKKRIRRLFSVCILLLFGRCLDLYLLVGPSVTIHPQFGWLEVGAFLGAGGLFILLFDRTFSAAPPVALRDPYLVESLHHHA